MHRMYFLREQCMHRCILSPFSETLHAKAVGTDPSGDAKSEFCKMHSAMEHEMLIQAIGKIENRKE